MASLLATLIIGLGATACGGSGSETPDPGPGEVHQEGDLRMDEQAMRAYAVDGAIRVEIPVEASGEASLAISGRVTLETLDGEEVGRAEDIAALYAGAAGQTVDTLRDEVGIAVFDVTSTFDLPASTGDSGVLGDVVVRYELRADSARLYGSRSLFEAWEKTAVRVLSTDVFDADGESWVRVVALDPGNDMPVAGATVAVGFETEDTFEELARATTDDFGVAAVPVAPGDTRLGDQTLAVRIVTPGGITEMLTAPVTVSREQRVMITTDKPLYQPGQVIHLRTLTLNSRSLEPAANEPVLIEIKDANGNKVGRMELETDDFGIAAGEFTLARELNMGTWQIAATVAGVTTERSVTVERYVLPKFNVVARPDREFYGPGDTARISLDVQYFFGQPVAGAEVLIEPYTFDVGFNPLPALTTTLDENGIGVIDVPIPSFLVGLPLEQGGTFVRVDVSVTDATEHTQTVTRNLTVSEAELAITVIPMTSILPGEDASFHIVTTDPVGRPVPANVTATLGDTTRTLTTSARGLGEATLPTEAGARSVTLEIEAASEIGNAERTVTFDTGYAADHGAIALLPDRSIAKVGETLEVSITTGAEIPRVFFDIIRAGQTLSTRTVDLEGGRATLELDIGADMTGALELNAYLVTSDAQVVRGGSIVWVEDAGGLNLAFSTPEEQYRPGDEAPLTISVTDRDGAGVPAAVGLTIVDEAVFALQDNRPGLERIYFQIEEELLEPRYTLYGISFESVVAPPESTPDEDREAAARVLMAASETAGYAVSLETLAPAITEARSLASTYFTAESNRIVEQFHVLTDAGHLDWNTWQSVTESERVLGMIVEPNDAWGRRVTLELEMSGDQVSAVIARSAGLDETWNTDDDLSQRLETWRLVSSPTSEPDWDNRDDFDAFPGGQPEAPVDEGAGGGETDGETGGGGDAPRVRSFFPETLLVEPAIITDPDGTATIPVTLADSITTWRVSGTANTQSGQLGSGTGGIVVFQDFFVDINFPVSLTQNDIVSVPIALFNYLEEPQTVELTVDAEASGDWYTLLSSDTLSVALDPGEITVRYFDVQVDKVGWHPFQVTAIGTEMSDAIRRVVEVVPDGQEQLVIHSDRLTGDVTRTVTIPVEAIDDASALFVKLYPGLFSQVIEGLDSLLQMPSGCFEQTSSTTYPNVLVMQYLQESGQSSPEIEMLATEYISQGYQRLVSYEVPGGGFEWFGNDPAHRILTAYGLLEFTDMAEVFPVDPAVIDRTRAWLASQQESDGRWRAAPEGIHEGATNNFQDSDVRATAYIAYAMLRAGDRSAGTLRAVDWVKANLSGIDDPYSLGLVANMLLVADRTDTRARQILSDLDDMKETRETDSGTIAWWESGSQSLYYGSGESMHMETTAFVLQAFIMAGTQPETVEQVVGYLISNKGEFGQFSSTQATIHALRAFTMLLSEATTSGEADVEVFLGDTLIDSIHIDAASSDLMRLFDLQDLVVEGDNEVTITIDGEGQFLYQIVGRYYLPWSEVGPPSSADIVSIDVAYDRTELAVDETVQVTATVRNNSDARLDMVMVDLGVPPGFDVVMADLERYASDAGSPVQRVERAGRQLTVYVYGLDAGEELVLEYGLRATMPLEATTPPSAVWLYYDADVRTEQAPVKLTVL
jgi:hypothetical protein